MGENWHSRPFGAEDGPSRPADPLPSCLPSYPYSEDARQGEQYMNTRCPAWCDRILMSPSAKELVLRVSVCAAPALGAEGRGTLGLVWPSLVTGPWGRGHPVWGMLPGWALTSFCHELHPSAGSPPSQHLGWGSSRWSRVPRPWAGGIVVSLKYTRVVGRKRFQIVVHCILGSQCALVHSSTHRP